MTLRRRGAAGVSALRGAGRTSLLPDGDAAPHLLSGSAVPPDLLPDGDVSPGDLLRAARTNTPLRAVEVRTGNRTRRVWLKLEMYNPTGSIKYRTALGLLAELHRARPLTPGQRLVESTSGNLGVALAALSARFGCEFLAVVDPKTPPPLRERMVALGAQLRMVDTPDGYGGFLRNRLDLVRRLLEQDPTLRWTDQYHSAAGPAVHRGVTAPELLDQTGGDLDGVFVAVSTGGTIAGLRAGAPAVAVHAVDVAGSIALGGSGHRHLLSGIGSTRRSRLVESQSCPWIHRVPDVTAIAMCRLLRAETGLALGASSGAVLAGYLRAVADGVALRRPVLVCADGATSYESTIYDDTWLAAREVLEPVRAATAQARAAGIGFTSRENTDGL